MSEDTCADDYDYSDEYREEEQERIERWMKEHEEKYLNPEE